MDDFARALVCTFGRRPYTFTFFAAYLIVAVRRLGARRVAFMTVTGYLIAWASEASSIRNGFPYGAYNYVEEGLRGELMLAGVPFFDSLSYVFMNYFAWEVGALLASAAHDLRAPRSRLLGALLVTALDVAVDPTAVLGDRWFLGRIFAYAEPGVYFGVPASNFAGWFLVGFVTIAIWQVADRLGAPRRPPRLTLPLERWYPAACYFGVAAFAIGVAAAIGEPALAAASTALFLPLLVGVVRRLGQTRVAPAG